MRNDQSSSRGQGSSALKIDSETFDRAKRVLRSPIKKRGSGSEAASLPRCQPSRQKPAHRFAQSGHESGYIFGLGFIFTNNPSILGFFMPQFGSCYKSRTEKMRVGYRRTGETDCRPGRRKQTYRQTCTPLRVRKPRSAEGRSVTGATGTQRSSPSQKMPKSFSG